MTDFSVQGQVAPGYEAVAEQFARLLADQPQGAALAVLRQGQPLVNLWGGARDKAGQLPWQQDTRVNIFSAGKALVAILLLQLVEQGQLALDQPVAALWPAFGANGKEAISLRQLLSHRSGVNAFHMRLNDADIFDQAQVTRLLEQETPWWTPDSAQGYSPVLYGWILAALACRATGAGSFNALFDQQINRRAGTRVDFGVAPEQQPLLADVGALKGARAEAGVMQLGKAMKADPHGVVNKAFTNPMSLMVGTNSAAWRSAEIPAANGVASALDLARIYDALLTGQLLDRVSACWQEQSAGDDRILQTPMRFSLGFMLTQAGGDRRLGRGERAFGHAGAGGCLGFADPDYGISFAFVSNQMAQSLLIDKRGEALIDALYQSTSLEPLS